ncbi:MAG: TetR/AcrR family transcriptional regulator [Burkholderiales bacterium]
MARPRSTGYADQRGKILASAAQLFALRGYSATSMNEVANGCGVSKATLYHYFTDKYDLLASIADGHVSRLVVLVDKVQAQPLAPEQKLRALIHGLLLEYADAQHAQRVLTAEARFLNADDARRVADKERKVVAVCAALVVALRPDLAAVQLPKPLTMLLFGMINWLFTWMKPGGALDHAAMAPIVADLFLGGLPAVRASVGSGHGSLLGMLPEPAV